MTDTIELLETIGKDASLRRTSGEELAKKLANLDASEALQKAVASGDSSHLNRVFGDMKLESSNHSSNTNVTAPEVPEEEEEEEEETPPNQT